MAKRRTVPEFQAAKGGTPLVVVTAYDTTRARLVDAAGIDAILVGDSLGMVVQGHSTPLPVTLRDMVYHTRMVTRGSETALIIADLPFGTYEASDPQAVRSATKLMKLGGAHAVKLEGGVRMASRIRACTDAGISVMAHIGLTPQSVHQLGGFKVQRDTERLLNDAKAIEEAGAFAVVVECVPSAVTQAISAALKIPTIGIGAGPADGQVLVWHDLLGLTLTRRPRFAKVYAEIGNQARAALSEYAAEVRERRFPTPQYEVT